MDFPKSVPGVGLVDGKFVDENQTTGQAGSLIPSAWGNAVTEELLNVIQAAGLEPDEDDNGQLLVAIQQLRGQILSKSVAGGAAVALSAVESRAPIIILTGAITANISVSVPAAGGQWIIANNTTGDFTVTIKAVGGAGVMVSPGTARQVFCDGANVFHTSTDALADLWALQPVGVPVPVFTHLAGVSSPPTDKAYRYIKLTASDAYNAGVLISESVSGAAPLVAATAVISLAGSPLNGQTVSLINTEKRVLRASTTSGELLSDAMQGHIHEYKFKSTASASTSITPTTYAPSSGGSGTNLGTKIADDSVNPYMIGEPLSDGTNGTPRTANETRAKSIGATYYMRIK